MASSLIAALDEMQSKIRSLGADMEALREENRVLNEEIQVLRRDIADLTTERDRARTDVEFLTISHKLADSPDSLIETRRFIASLIRNIDRCIEMLKE